MRIRFDEREIRTRERMGLSYFRVVRRDMPCPMCVDDGMRVGSLEGGRFCVEY